MDFSAFIYPDPSPDFPARRTHGATATKHVASKSAQATGLDETVDVFPNKIGGTLCLCLWRQTEPSCRLGFGAVNHPKIQRAFTIDGASDRLPRLAMEIKKIEQIGLA
jgi:hypothetical protein